MSLATLKVHPRVAERWGVLPGGVDWLVMLRLAPVPLLGLVGLTLVAGGLRLRSHGWPYVGAALVFLSGYLGLAAGFFPYVVPYAVSFRDAASTDSALGLMLCGVAILLPMILAYTAFVYWLFRGKIDLDAGYH